MFYGSDWPGNGGDIVDVLDFEILVAFVSTSAPRKVGPTLAEKSRLSRLLKVLDEGLVIFGLLFVGAVGLKRKLCLGQVQYQLGLMVGSFREDSDFGVVHEIKDSLFWSHSAESV